MLLDPHQLDACWQLHLPVCVSVELLKLHAGQLRVAQSAAAQLMPPGRNAQLLECKDECRMYPLAAVMNCASSRDRKKHATALHAKIDL